MYKMKSTKGSIIITLIIIASIIGASVFGYDLYSKNTQQQEILDGISTTQAELDAELGAFRPSSYTGKLLTRLSEGGSESTFNTTPGTAKDSSTLTTAKIGDFAVFTINPGAANEEKISVSAVSVSGTTATWTIINRGLSFTENVAITANKKQHAIGETVIISNDDHYINQQYVNVDDAQTISGIKTFSASPLAPTPTTDSQVAIKSYVDGVALVSAPDANETTKGVIELSTAAEAAAGTSLGSTGARLVLPGSLATSTPNASTATGNIVASLGRYIKQTWLDLSEAFSFSGGLTSTATTTIAASGVASAPLTLNGISYQFPSADATASGYSLTSNASGVLSWASTTNKLFATTTPSVFTGATSHTILTTTIPANIITGTNGISGEFMASLRSVATTEKTITLAYGGTTCGTATVTPDSYINTTLYGKIEIIIQANNSSSAQTCSVRFLGQLNAMFVVTSSGNPSVSMFGNGSAVEDATSAQTLVITFAQNISDTFTIYNGFINWIR